MLDRWNAPLSMSSASAVSVTVCGTFQFCDENVKLPDTGSSNVNRVPGSTVITTSVSSHVENGAVQSVTSLLLHAWHSTCASQFSSGCVASTTVYCTAVSPSRTSCRSPSRSIALTAVSRIAALFGRAASSTVVCSCPAVITPWCTWLVSSCTCVVSVSWICSSSTVSPTDSGRISITTTIDPSRMDPTRTRDGAIPSAAPTSRLSCDLNQPTSSTDSVDRVPSSLFSTSDMRSGPPAPA
mmetsp:Transcript_25077/g.80896  ORF Transcript_25077/g.80896 Transcript_25077/m.80896 type:complete len:240 (-) Transcript_25077:589-1308(-)